MQKAEKVQRAHKTFNELTFTDDYMFRAVLRENIEICRGLIELILNIEVDHLDFKGDDYAVSAGTDTRSIRLDVYLKDDKGTVYDIEMENWNKPELPKRTRYYQSMLDVNHFDPSISFPDLPESYILFICTTDPFNEGLCKYEFTDMCRQVPMKELGTGATKVFINAKGRRADINREMQDFLDYLCDNNPRNDFTKDIETTIAHVKRNEDKRSEYMFFELSMMDARREAMIEGRAEGRAEGEISRGYKDVEQLVMSGLADEVRACEVLGVEINDYREYIASKS